MRSTEHFWRDVVETRPARSKTNAQMTKSFRIPLNVGSAEAGALRTLSLRSLNTENWTATTIETAILTAAILKTAIRIDLHSTLPFYRMNTFRPRSRPYVVCRGEEGRLARLWKPLESRHPFHSTDRESQCQHLIIGLAGRRISLYSHRILCQWFL